MKASRQDIASALKALPAHVKAVLLYGPDEGLVRERAKLIGGQIVEDISDPFRVAQLSPEMLKAEPSRLADEMAAISMIGGRRLVLLDGAGDQQVSSIEAALAQPSDSLLVISGGDLAKASKLRKAFENGRALLAIPCYADDARDLIEVIRESLKVAGLSIDPDALSWLGGHLGNDRQVTRRELEKLILYKGEGGERRISLDDARESTGDSSDLTLSDIAGAVSGGELDRLDGLLEKARIAGDSPVAILRVVLMRFQRLHLARGHMRQGLEASSAAAKLMPPLFFKEKDAFIRHLAYWPLERIEQALLRLQEAEADCKTTGLPAETIADRVCLALAASVRRR